VHRFSVLGLALLVSGCYGVSPAKIAPQTTLQSITRSCLSLSPASSMDHPLHVPPTLTITISDPCWSPSLEQGGFGLAPNAIPGTIYSTDGRCDKVLGNKPGVATGNFNVFTIGDALRPHSTCYANVTVIDGLGNTTKVWVVVQGHYVDNNTP
jgi:hypothetical protein